MSLIPQDFIQELLGRVDIVEVVGRAVQLKKAGTNYKGLCPFHSEKSASFTVSPSKQFYHCFGCGAHGSAIGFLMEHSGMGFPDAVRELARDAGMELPQQEADEGEQRRAAEQRSHKARLREVLQQAEAFYRERLRASTRAIDYLKGRGLSGRSAARYGLGYAPDDWQGLARVFPNYEAELLLQSGLVVARDAQGQTLEPAQAAGAAVARRYDRLRDRITFPIRNAQGEIIGFGGRVLDRGEPKYINSPETELFHKGEELYGLFEARQAIQRHGQVLVVEGYLDVIALAQHGVEHAVATLGTACTPDHVRKLFRYCAQIVFSFDGDTAGRRAAARAMQSALPALSDERSVKFLFLPAEHDPDSFVRELGADAFEREIARARPLSVFLLDHVGEGLALDTAEGRAQAIARSRELLASIPESALKGQILHDLAQRLRTPADELRAALALQGGRRGAASGTSSTGTAEGSRPGIGRSGGDGTQGSFARAKPAEPRMQRLNRPKVDHAHTAMRILLAHPALWRDISAAQHDLLVAHPGSVGELARWLESYLDEHAEPTPSSIWEALRAENLLEAAEALEPAELLERDAAELRPDLRGALESIEMAWIKQRQQALAAEGLADAASRLEYQGLSLRLRELMRSLPRL
ncbi:MAG: DNA primase [Betaproteobacteria bacterium]|nr:DNA primase [Betaproteobacteria bacterium]